jgi:hypothetical protein
VTAARLITVGHVTHDRYGDDIVAGGCAFYAARTQAALGADVHLVTAVGDDFACDDALAGLTVDVTRGGVTTLFTNLYPEGSLRVQRIEAMAPMVRAAGAPARRGAGAPGAGAARDRPRGVARGGRRSSGGDRGAGLDQGSRPRGDGGADAVAGRRRALGAGGVRGVRRGGPRRAGRPARPAVPPRAGGGVHARQARLRRDRARRDHPRRHLPDAVEVDPTGAGDTFAAGFFLGLAEGRTPVDAAKLGAAAASIVVEGRGGATLPRIGEAHARVAQIA